MKCNCLYSADKMQVDKLKKACVQKFIADLKKKFFKTQEERGWGYIVRRKYRCDVTVNQLRIVEH